VAQQLVRRRHPELQVVILLSGHMLSRKAANNLRLQRLLVLLQGLLRTQLKTVACGQVAAAVDLLRVPRTPAHLELIRAAPG
jgi:hypothetical protein